MSDLMLFGVLRMPYEMAMGDELSRFQFYQRVQEAADRLEKAEARVTELDRMLMADDDLCTRQALRIAALEAALSPQDAVPHLFEFWWAEYMPEAKQHWAWAAWQAATRAQNVGVAAQHAAPAPQAREQLTFIRERAQLEQEWSELQHLKQSYAREPLTERQIVRCLVEAGCLGTVKMSFESGPYDITRSSVNADKLVRAVEKAHAIQAPAKQGGETP